MKITFISEDHPGGLDVDWPVLPRAGDNVSFTYRGGTNTLRVIGCDYRSSGDGQFDKVMVHLTY